MCRTCRHNLMYTSCSSKTCTACKQDLHLSEFRIRTRKTPRPRPVCKKCESLEQAARLKRKREENPTAVREKKRRWSQENSDSVRKTCVRTKCRKLGWEEHFITQVVRYSQTKLTCEICGLDPSLDDSRYNRLSVDHCHTTNEFRGMLCNSCNLAIGKFQDKPELLLRAVEYLKRPRPLTFPSTQVQSLDDKNPEP